MSFPAVERAAQIGARAFNHSRSDDAEREYDRLRDLARKERHMQDSLMHQAQGPLNHGRANATGALVAEAKEHGERARRYNQQASEFVFRENNAEGRVEPDTIDLHGQFVQEAEDLLEEKIKIAQGQGQTHLHVIVGKGNHSVNHVQKLKPRVEQVCRELGLQYHTEPNAGRIYVNLTGGPAEPNYHGGGHGGQQQHHQQPYGGQQHQQPHGGQHHGGQQHGGQQHHGRPAENMQMEEEVKKALPKIFKMLKGCCTVM